MIDLADDRELVALLRKAELFSSMGDEDLAFAASRSDLVALGPGELLFEKGERARRFYIVRAGAIDVFRAEPGGSERAMARYIAGDAIGDFDFAVGSILDASARADGQAELVAFPGGAKDMRDLAAERPQAAARILLRSLSMISSRLRSTQRSISANSPLVRELRRQIYTDPGTGLWSRAFLDEELRRELPRPTALVMIKPDRFKELIELAGHSAGDEAMALLAALLSAEVQGLGRGWAFRLRSNETAVVVPNCDRPEAEAVAGRLAAAIAAMVLPLPGGSAFSFTSSMALGLWPEDGEDWSELFEAANVELLRAWREGGNRLYALGESRGGEA